jgi:hypothetical protein
MQQDLLKACVKKTTGLLFAIAFFIAGQSSYAIAVNPNLVGGSPANGDRFTEVMAVSSAGVTCTGTLVGPRVLLMAARCVSAENPLVTFTVANQTFKAMGMVSPFYSSGHDIALAVVIGQTVPVEPAWVGGSGISGGKIWVLGYGSGVNCGSTNSSQLTYGVSVVQQTTDLEMVSNSSAITLCKEDAGSPAFVEAYDRRRIAGIGTFTNDNHVSHFIRTDSDQSLKFFGQIAQSFGVDICGITADCY